MGVLQTTTGSHPQPRNADGDVARGRVLVVDDDTTVREALATVLVDQGYAVEVAGDGEQGLRRLATFEPDVVLTDLKMPILDGLGLIEEGRRRAPYTAFILMSGVGSVETALEAVRLGAETYVTKPAEPVLVSQVVAQALNRARLSRQVAELRRRAVVEDTSTLILGEHPSMKQLLARIGQVAKSRATVLIRGKSGTGKELVARAIHELSSRASGPLVSLNCAALTATLLESELFGHERGSFTGATGRREGRFMQADGGTLFLDEVSELSPQTQVKLLRFLQERAFERVGGNETLHVDVRVVAATNRDLQAMVRNGSFREDLYYRLNVVALDLPPLSERRSDIPLLAHHFLWKYARENDRVVKGFTPEALDRLMANPWPGNVRELENAVERAVVMSEGEWVDMPPPSFASPFSQGEGLLAPGLTLAEVERAVILRTLETVDGSTSEAAHILGISQRKIQYRLKEWGMTAKEVARGSEAPRARDSEPPRPSDEH